MIKKIAKKVEKGVKVSNERGARQQILEDLFYDFNRSRFQVYRMNFFRGIFFGLGTVIGGTVVVALAIWILSQFVGWFDWIPYIGEYLRLLVETMKQAK